MCVWPVFWKELVFIQQILIKHCLGVRYEARYKGYTEEQDRPIRKECVARIKRRNWSLKQPVVRAVARPKPWAEGPRFPSQPGFRAGC